jgi:hypothetical protein
MTGPMLLIPASGLLEVVVDADQPLSRFIAAALQENGDHVGQIVAMASKLNHEHQFTVAWFVGTGPSNERARMVFAYLTGAHVLFTGPVAFDGLSAEVITGIVADISRNEGTGLSE